MALQGPTSNPLHSQPVVGGNTTPVKAPSQKGTSKIDETIKGLGLGQKLAGTPDQAATSLATKPLQPSSPSTQATVQQAETTAPSLPVSTYPSTLAEKQAMCDKFQVGDVVVARVSNRDKKYETVDFFIMLLQRFAKWIGKSNAGSDHSAVHISVVVGIDKTNGRVLISEAMPSRTGLRTVDLLSHDACVLDKTSGYSYQVMRPTTPYAETALKAAEIARRVAPKASYLLTEQEKVSSQQTPQKDLKWSKFSFTLALKGMFKRHDNFDLDAQKRVFKGIFDEAIQAQRLTGGKEPRKVYCSAFGSQIFQRAEAERAWKVIVERNQSNADFQKDLEEFRQLAKEVGNKEAPNKDKQISKWSKAMAKKYGAEMQKEMKSFHMDFKHTAPQDFVDYFQRNGIVKSEFNIQPPA